VKFEDGLKLDFDDVLIKPKRSTLTSRSGVDLIRSYSTLNSKMSFEVCPLIAANMDSTGTFAMANTLSEHRMMTCLHKHYDVEELSDFFGGRLNADSFTRTKTFFTIGIKEEDVDKLILVNGLTAPTDEEDSTRCGMRPTGFSCICIDVANGYQKVFVDHVSRIRSMFPQAVIMAGNVCTPEMVSELLISGGADIIKIGIGPGSVCSTRRITGCGYPQLSAIIECVDAAHGVGGLICADGGCKEPGDVVKAFAAGADFVMLGGMLAGTDECDGEWEYHPRDQYRYKDPTSSIWGTQCFHEGGICGFNASDGSLSIVTSDKSKHEQYTTEAVKKSLLFYGMSSEAAMNKHSGGMGSYRASEGIIKSVPYKGPVENVLQEVAGGIRSACAYVGAPTLKDLPKCATFVIRRRGV